MMETIKELAKTYPELYANRDLFWKTVKKLTYTKSPEHKEQIAIKANLSDILIKGKYKIKLQFITAEILSKEVIKPLAMELYLLTMAAFVLSNPTATDEQKAEVQELSHPHVKKGLAELFENLESIITGVMILSEFYPNETDESIKTEMDFLKVVYIQREKSRIVRSILVKVNKELKRQGQ